MMTHQHEMSFETEETDPYGHRRLGGIGDKISALLQDLSPQHNNGRRINTVNQRLGYLVRCGNPDAMDSIVPMAFGNLAIDLILSGSFGRLVSLRHGVYDSVPINVVMGNKKVVDVHKYYDTAQLRPKCEMLLGRPLLIMSSDV